MKTSLAIMLAAAALTIGTATISPISSTAVAGGGGPAGSPSIMEVRDAPTDEELDER